MNQALLYSKYNGLQKNDATYVLDNYLRLIRWKPDGNDTVLDVGCGSGDVTTRMLLPSLPPNFGKLIGGDLSEEMVEFAKSQNHNPNVGFCTIDISSRNLRLDFLDQFDHLFSFYCLHWIQDQRQAFTNMYNLLKPGGDMLVAFLASNPIFHIYENMSANSKWMEYMHDTNKFISPYQNCNDPERTIQQLLDDIGFSTHLCTVVERKYVYPDVGVLRKSVVAVSPFLGQIPGELHNDYLADFISEVRNLNYIECAGTDDNNNEGKVRVPYKLVIVMASKPSN